MTNSFILHLKMEKEKNLKAEYEIKLKIKRLYCELANYSIPYFKTSKDIKAKEIEQIGNELLSLKTELEEIEQRISEIKEQLGE